MYVIKHFEAEEKRREKGESIKINEEGTTTLRKERKSKCCLFHACLLKWRNTLSEHSRSCHMSEYLSKEFQSIELFCMSKHINLIVINPSNCKEENVLNEISVSKKYRSQIVEEQSKQTMKEKRILFLSRFAQGGNTLNESLWKRFFQYRFFTQKNST